MRDKSTLRKILFPLLLLALLPAMFFTAYEVSNISERERVISETYRQQLDAILFSVNQYAWDVVNSWVINLAGIHQEQSSVQAAGEQYQKFLTLNRSVSAIILTDSMASVAEACLPTDNQIQEDSLSSLIQNFLSDKSVLSKQLQRYRQIGYRKIEPLYLTSQDSASGQEVLLLFALGNNPKSSDYQLAGLLLNPRQFIESFLSPKLMEIISDELKMSIFHKAGQITIGKNPPLDPATTLGRKKLWLFPDYQLGIRPAGQTIEELASSRFYRNLALLILLDAVLIFTAIFVYRNIRREMELVRMKSDFVSNISHELRTPLALIRMFAETLEMGRVPSEKRKQEYYQIIGQETERLTHLVNNILNFSRIEAGKKEYHLQSVDVNSIAENVMKNYRFHLESQGFDLEMNLAESLEKVPGDKEAISEALINLLDNGVKYSEEKKFIRLSSGRENGSVFLAVEDKGMGIAPENQKAIFEKFHRVSGALVHNTKGSGLGLTLVKHIMDAHNGSIAVESAPGKGSRFQLIFPLAEAGNGASDAAKEQ